MQTGHTTRRTLIKSAVVVSIASAVLGVNGVMIAGATTPRTFRIDHDPSLRVRITPGERFQVTVLDTNREVVEHFPSLTVAELFRQPSELFAVTEVRVPSAA